jgi:hypothetical protein
MYIWCKYGVNMVMNMYKGCIKGITMMGSRTNTLYSAPAPPAAAAMMNAVSAPPSARVR